MNDKVDAVQESIKLALDAADAATDVTSEYNTVRKQHKILEDKVKQIHKYTTVVFVSSIVSGIFVVIVSTISQLGDIFVSYFKRKSKLKDTGKIIPGHGGLLDRIDGMLFAFPSVYLIILSNTIDQIWWKKK